MKNLIDSILTIIDLLGDRKNVLWLQHALRSHERLKISIY